MMRLGIFGTVVLATGLLASASGGAADGPAEPAAPSLANTCQSGIAPKLRITACEALLHDPNLPPKLAAPVFFSIGFSQIDLHDANNALVSFTNALEKDPGFWPASWVRAQLLEERREYGAAFADWSQVVTQQPALAGAYAHRAAVADDLGRSDEAIADYTKAIALAAPTAPIDQYYADRGVAHMGDGQFDLAIADYTAAIQRNDQNAAAYAGRGRATFLKGDATAATDDLRKASELAPADIYDALWLYLAETESGRHGADGLRSRIGQLPMARWPGPLVHVFLGEAKPEQVKPAPSDPAGWSAPDRQAGAACEMAFFLGEFYRLHGQQDRAIASFRAALATHVQEFIEYHAAEAELARLAR
ncbi:MAG TPA: hypothetical protein VKQ29_11315 [Aliidongia sp.]|nr:hypothetical protein [Aliidongia sp.]